MIKSIPHPRNSCAGAYSDWLEVMLTDKCNGRCAWCVERGGFHPTKRAEYPIIARAALKTLKQNIILLGGEPTMYHDIGKLIDRLAASGRSVSMTTNGSMLTPDFVGAHLMGLSNINISIHHYDLLKNEEITGIKIERGVLADSIKKLHGKGKCMVRLNCNCIRGNIDSMPSIKRYILFARKLGADSVRLAELKFSNKFVDLTKILANMPEDPFTGGCSQDMYIYDMPVNVRLMCGLQTPFRAPPENPQQQTNSVLYYDGKVYSGWQREEADMLSEKKKEELINQILRLVRRKELSAIDGCFIIEALNYNDKTPSCKKNKRKDDRVLSNDISSADGLSRSREIGSLGCRY